MQRTIVRVLTLVMLLTLIRSTPLAPVAAEPEEPQDVRVYQEDFTDYNYKEYADPTVAWDVFSNTLSLASMSGRYQSLPAAAPDIYGGVYVVWEEIRETGKGWDIYAQRLDKDGNRLWAKDVRVHFLNDHTNQMKPVLAVDTGGNAIVVWHDERACSASGCSVYAQKLSPDGERLWTADMQVNGAPAYINEWNVRQIAIVTDENDNALVVWQGSRDDKADLEIYAQKIAPDGTRLWATDIQVSDDDGTSTPQRVPDADVDIQGNAVIVWVDGRHGGEDIYAQRLDTSGNRLWLNDVPVSDGTAVEHQGDTSIAVDSQGNGIVVWQYGARRQVPANGAVYAQKISTTGQRLWSSNVQVNQNTNQCSRDWPSVGVTSMDVAVVVWASYVPDHNLYMQRVGTDGIPEWSSDKVISNFWNQPYTGRIRLDSTDQAYLVWLEWIFSGSNDIFLQQIDPDTGMTLWPGYAVRVEQGDGSTAHIYPDVVSTPGGQATVVWGDFRRGDWAVYGQRVDAGGNTVWPASYLVNLDPASQGWMPAAAGDTSGNVVVVWQGVVGVMAQCIDASGNRQWTSDLVVREAGVWYQDPDIIMAPDGTFYVVWLQQRQGTEWWDVRAQRIDANGQRLWSADQRINQQDYILPENWTVRPFEPAVAVNDAGDLIVAWYGNTITGTDVYLQRVSPEGNPVWSQDVSLNAHLPDIGEGETVLWSTNTAVALVADTDIFVAWVDNRNDDLDIYMQKLDLSGNLLWTSDERANSDVGTSGQRSPVMTLATDGDFVLVWQDSRNGPLDVYAQRFSIDGMSEWGDDVQVNQIANIWASEINVSRQSLDHFVLVWRSAAMNGNENVYVQRLNADGTVEWASDVCLTDSGYYYYPSGAVRSKTVDTTPDDILQATLTADIEMHGGEAQFYLTNDGGDHWSPVTPGVTHVFTTTSSDLRWQVELATSPAWVDNVPIIERVRIEYHTNSGAGDDYEPDDTCSLASPLQVNGAVQTHDFHQSHDEDWVWFDVISDTTYVLQTTHAGPNADTVLELYDTCGHPIMTDTNTFGHDARLVFAMPFPITLRARITNLDGNVFGEGTDYDLSVRTYHPNGLAVVVAGHNDDWELQSNIDYTADQAYLTLLNAGFPRTNVHYLGPDLNRDVDGNGLNDDIVATATISNVHYAIQDWPREKGIASGIPLYVYLMDHGHYDLFLSDGSAGRVTAPLLDLWLSNLEATTGTDQITVIIDACKSGSFIDVTPQGPAEISGLNRVIVASTTSRANAYPSEQGSLFSDVFWTALGDNQDVWSAYQAAKAAVDARGTSQTPWLDDNGDAVMDELDGDLARGRGLAGSFSGSEPVIDWVQVGSLTPSGTPGINYTAVITAQVRDDFAVEDVHLEMYVPSFVEPPPAPAGTTPSLDVPTDTLSLMGSDLYTTNLGGLAERGWYRLVVYAHDDEGKQAIPQAVLLCVDCSHIYLPLVLRGW